MIYLYDRRIADDLSQSFSEGIKAPSVKVIGEESVLDIVAQMENDNINFPLLSLNRSDYQIDTSRSNFTRIHKGVHTVFDSDTNEYYNEKAMPITLEYDLSILTTNTADMDEMIRELIFKYSSMYFLDIDVPYESKRKIRFGVCADQNTAIQRASGPSEYIKTGRLYESVIRLRCEGCVLLTYTPVKLTRTEYSISPDTPR